MSKIKRLAGETALYGLGSIVPRVINFFLIVPHTAAFDPDEYGVVADLYAYVAFLNVLFTFGMETTFFRFATKPGADPKQVFNYTQTSVLIITVVLTTAFISLADPIARSMSQEHANFVNSNYIVWLVCVVAIDAIVAIPFAKLRFEKKAILFATAKIINVLIIVVLNFYFLSDRHYDPEFGVAYVFLFNLIGNAFFIPFFLKTLLQWRPAFRKDVFSEMIQYAYPIMLTGLAGTTNEMFSRITLLSWLPENFYPGKSARYALGVFAACYKYAVFMNLAVQAFRFAAEPFFFSNAADKDSPALFARVNHYFVIVCCILLLGVSINIDILKYILRDEAYWEGLHIVPILLTGYLFLGVYYNLTVWFKLTDKTYFGTITTLTGAAITILMNYLLIPLAGYTGSSWATLICYFSMAALCYWLGQRYYPIPYAVGKGLLYIVVTLAIVYVVNQVSIANQWLATSFHLAVCILATGGFYLLERKGLRAKSPIT